MHLSTPPIHREPFARILLKIFPLIFVCVSFGAVVINQASNWWERALATHAESEISPDGCLRLESYTPFWVLPSIFHDLPHPDSNAGYGITWGGPGFYRLFEVSSGKFLGESIVFDKSTVDGPIYWGEWDDKRHRSVWRGGFLVAETDKCSDMKAQAIVLEDIRENGALRRAAAIAARERFQLMDSKEGNRVQSIDP
jgi:hypothetical protein